MSSKSETKVKTQKWTQKFLTEAESLSFVFEADKNTDSYKRLLADEKLHKTLLANTELSESDAELNKVFDSIFHDGKYYPLVSNNVDITKMPAYFDLDRMVRAQKTVQFWSASLGLATLGGMILETQLRQILLPMLKFGRAGTVGDIYASKVGAIKHTMSVYQTPFYHKRDPETQQLIEGWKSILLIRGVHEHLFKLVNNNMSCKEAHMEADEARNSAKRSPNEPKAVRKPLWANQHDMAVFQFGFVGQMMVDPKRCGAHFHSREQMEQVLGDITYLWRVYTHFLGVDDSFNIFQFADSFDKQRRFYLGMFNHIKFLLNGDATRAQPAEISNTTTNYGRAMEYAFAKLAPVLDYNVLDHWWRGTGLSFSGKPLQPYSPVEFAKMSAYYFATQIVLKNQTLIPFVSAQMEARFGKFAKDVQKSKEKLNKKHADIAFQLKPNFEF